MNDAGHFYDPKYEAELNYLRRLSLAKITANDYFYHGAVMRDLPH